MSFQMGLHRCQIKMMNLGYSPFSPWLCHFMGMVDLPCESNYLGNGRIKSGRRRANHQFWWEWGRGKKKKGTEALLSKQRRELCNFFHCCSNWIGFVNESLTQHPFHTSSRRPASHDNFKWGKIHPLPKIVTNGLRSISSIQHEHISSHETGVCGTGLPRNGRN